VAAAVGAGAAPGASAALGSAGGCSMPTAGGAAGSGGRGGWLGVLVAQAMASATAIRVAAPVATLRQRIR
jgi:hypothetical protein